LIKKTKNLINGIHAVSSFLEKYPQNIIQMICIEDSKNIRLNNLLAAALELDIPIIKTNKHDLSKMAPGISHQGILCEILFPTPNDVNHFFRKKKYDHKSIVLILDSITDPRNLGACLRSASAFNVDAVILNKYNSAPINQHVFKTSVGALLNLDIYYAVNLTRTIEQLKDYGYWIIGLDGDINNDSIFNEKFLSKTCLTLGSEAKGIRPLIKKNCDKLLNIPINKNTESLNISVATGIALYELNRQFLS